MKTNLVKGMKYNVKSLSLIGWTVGDGSGAEGYTLENYFDAEGTYRGPDICGIEPIIA